MGGTLILSAIEWWTILGTTPLEIIATCASVTGVFLIARQNIWGWPLGLIWAGISAYLAFTAWSLVSDGILYLTYIPLQCYCWFVWLRRGGRRQAELSDAFIPTWLPRRRQILLTGAAAVSIAIWAHAMVWLAANLTWFPTPALLWRDSTTTVLNFYGQFLQARKRMENWTFWLIVNTLGIHIYWVKGSPIYSLQYGIFLVLGLYGWWRWHRSRGGEG
jgi:nicotinamide mononucleotide transporter